MTSSAEFAPISSEDLTTGLTTAKLVIWTEMSLGYTNVDELNPRDAVAANAVCRTSMSVFERIGFPLSSKLVLV